MKTLSEIKFRNNLLVQPETFSVKSLLKKYFDTEVFLESYRKNLQRELVWNLKQKQELIMSIIVGREIPVFLAIQNKDEVIQIIDGKQRLSTIISFLKDEFKIELDGNEFKMSELPYDFIQAIQYSTLNFRVHCDGCGYDATDDDKLNWFKFANFAGTQLDKDHLKSFVR